MTPEFVVPSENDRPIDRVEAELTGSRPELGRDALGRRLCVTCHRVAQRERPWCWFCDPDIPAEVKLAARRKRTARVLEDVDLSTPMSRRHAREALAQAIIDQDISETKANAVAKIIADQAREDTDARAAAPEKAPVILEVQSFRPAGNGATP